MFATFGRLRRLSWDLDQGYSLTYYILIDIVDSDLVHIPNTKNVDIPYPRRMPGVAAVP